MAKKHKTEQALDPMEALRIRRDKAEDLSVEVHYLIDELRTYESDLDSFVEEADRVLDNQPLIPSLDADLSGLMQEITELKKTLED